MVAGDWRLAVGGGWRLVAVGGGWPWLVVGDWWLVVVGGWRLAAVGGPWGRSLGTVLCKKGGGVLIRKKMIRNWRPNVGAWVHRRFLASTLEGEGCQQALAGHRRGV